MAGRPGLGSSYTGRTDRTPSTPEELLTRMAMCRKRPDPGAALLLLLLAGSCSSTPRGEGEKVATRVQHGQYAQALEEARRLAEEHPEDARLQELLRDAQVAYVLDQGRRAVFQGELTEGLRYFDQALAIDPENSVVAAWIEKTRYQLAQDWLDRAAELTGPNQLDEAEQAYEKVLEYVPDNAKARDGLARVLLLKNYRAGQSKTYFDEGLRSFRETLLQQAHRAFMVSHRYLENEPAATRGEQVEAMLAQERLTQAKSFEDGGHYFAARIEYRLVLLIEPDNAEAKAGIDRMDRETRATSSIARADMEMRRGEFDHARASLEQASLLTQSQQDQVSLLESGIEDRRFQQMYDEARNLESDFRYPEAVAAFERLLAVAPDFQDAQERRKVLQEFIQLSEELYAKVLSAEDDEAAERSLRAIRVVWPEYRDVAQRLQAIEARRAAREKDAPQGPGVEDGRAEGGR